MNGPSIALESILPCLQGVIPSPLATGAPDGTPNITYMSIVQYVDSERVALSRQFFRKTASNLERNPQAQVLLVDPITLEQYHMDLRYLHTETEGPTFETMRANLEAIAAHTGVGDVFRLRGVDIHRVVHIERIGEDPLPDREPSRDVIKGLDDFVRRVGRSGDYEEATQQALQALEDLFDFPHAILLVAPEGTDRLFGIAGNGYRASSAGAEVAPGEGLIGTAASRRQVICVPNMARTRVMGSAVQESAHRRGGSGLGVREIPLPGLDDVQSAAAVPLVVHDTLAGVLYLESDRPGCFGAHNERLLRIIGGHLAAALSALESDREVEPHADAPPSTGPALVAAAGETLEVTYYQADDSVFAGGEYIIKGVPGRILWKLVREHAGDGRRTFTNRELRLDEGLGLPAGNDNLEARLVALRRRLAAGGWGIGLERVGRGRMALDVAGPLTLVEVPTRGLMQAAHTEP